MKNTRLKRYSDHQAKARAIAGGALGRTDAVVSMVMVALNNDEARIADFVLIDVIWSAQSQLALIRKMNDHAHATTTPINSSTTNPVRRV